jgi:hypothetical protein
MNNMHKLDCVFAWNDFKVSRAHLCIKSSYCVRLNLKILEVSQVNLYSVWTVPFVTWDVEI